MKTALSILGVRRYKRYYRNGMLTRMDKVGAACYIGRDELELIMRLNYAHNVATYESDKCGFDCSKDLYYNNTYETCMQMTLAEIESDAMQRRLRGEEWLEEWKGI